MFLAFSLNFAIAHVQKKIVMLISAGLSNVTIKHKETDLSLETSSEINFELIKFVKNCNCLPLTNQN